MAAEIRAIATIGRVLGDIPDVTTRVRILCWANERFIPEVSDNLPQSANDPKLGPAPDTLDDLFEEPRETNTSEHSAFASDAPTPRKRGLLVDFRLLGRRMVRRMKHPA